MSRENQNRNQKTEASQSGKYSQGEEGFKEVDSFSDQDALWKVLEYASVKKEDPFFVQKVRRKIAITSAKRSTGWVERFFHRKAWVVACGGALGVLMLSVYLSAMKQPSSFGRLGGIATKAQEINAERKQEAGLQVLLNDEELLSMETHRKDLEEQVMAIALQDPSVLQDEELMSMLY